MVNVSLYFCKNNTHKDWKLCKSIAPVLAQPISEKIATADLLSDGRVIVGLGPGAFPDEFINYSPQGYFDEPRERVDRFIEGLQIMINLWTTDQVTFNGKFYNLKDAVLLPKTVQKPYPPLWCGGVGPRMLRITAKYFDAWVPSRGSTLTPTPEKYEAGVKAIGKYLRKYGRSVKNFTFALLGWMTEKVVDDIDNIEKFVQAGCNYYIVEIPLTPLYPMENTFS